MIYVWSSTTPDSLEKGNTVFVKAELNHHEVMKELQEVGTVHLIAREMPWFDSSKFMSVEHWREEFRKK